MVAETSPPSYFTPICHPLVDEVTQTVDGYFLQHWPFKNEKARKKFVAAGFSRVTCLYFPKALNDRIHFACRLLTVLFLIDDVLEHMSFSDGAAYNEKLIPISRGDVQPDRSVPVEYIIYDLWESMRAHDRVLADEVLEPVFTFMRAQTERVRASPMSLGQYFEYRERDVGKALLSALMRYSMALHITDSEVESVRDIEMNCSKHIYEEGGVLCSSVQIMVNEMDISVDAAKRILRTLCREWELQHYELLAKAKARQPMNQTVQDYVQGLEYQMSGNELWSQTTKRYSEAVEPPLVVLKTENAWSNGTTAEITV